MEKQKKILIFILAFGLLPLRVFAATSGGTSGKTQTPSLQVPFVPPIINQISQAKTLLSSISLTHQLSPVYKNITNKKTKKVTKTLTGYSLSQKDVALAILDPFNGQITTTVGNQNDTNMDFPDRAVDVQLAKFNGVNSRFTVNRPAGGTVVALKYLLSKNDTGSKRAIEQGLSEAVYVPYSQNLSSPEVIAYGQSYLNGVIANVAAQLQNVPSTAVPGETVTQAVPPSMIKALIYAEHSDTTALLKGDVQDLLDQMNILLAVNGPDTYKYSGSTAGALGIAQFISSTYGSLVKRHPDVGLMYDFTAGMQDHQNAIKAMYLLLDDYAGTVRVKAQNAFVTSRVFDYGAASYNGGTSRVAKAVAEFGDNWNQDRSGQIAGLQNDIGSLAAEVKSLKSKVKIAKDKKTKASFQSQLTSAQSQLSSDNSQLADIQSASLKNETINYLLKIYKVIAYFNQEQPVAIR